MEGKTSLKLVSFFCFSAVVGFFLGGSFSSFGNAALYCGSPNSRLAAAAMAALPNEEVRVPIAVYHSVRPYKKGESAYQDRYDVTPELFRKHLEYLRENGYSPITFEALADHFDAGAPLPQKPVILSFDDSWRNQYEYAFPLLKEFGFTGTFFVFTNSLGRGSHLSWNEVREMQKGGMEIGSHTKTHPYLDNIKDEKTLENEIFGSKKILEEELGIAIYAFAYPFGEHSTTTLTAVKNARYGIARALSKGVTQNAQNRYALSAFLTTDSLEDFVRMITK